MPMKVIGARELLDSLATATGFQEREVASRPAAANAKAKAKGGAAGPVTLARFFDTREYDDDPTEYAYGVPQVLKLMNTNLTNRSAPAAKSISRVEAKDAPERFSG